MKPLFIRDFANIGRYGRDDLPFSIVSYGRGRRKTFEGGENCHETSIFLIWNYFR